MNKKSNELLSYIARLYYYKNQTQQEISRLVGISRPKVNRLLKEAREKGIVRIWVDEKNESFSELEESVRKTFNLYRVIICNSAPDDISIRRNLGIAGAKYLSENIRLFNSLAFSWGRTIWEVVRSLEDNPVTNKYQIDIVQINGGTSQIFNDAEPAEIGETLAKTLGGRYYFLHAPALMGSSELCSAVMADKYISETLDRARNADVALIGIGSLRDFALRKLRYISQTEFMNLEKDGIVGDISLRFFDINGKKVDNILNSRLIGLTLEEIKAIPNVVGIAGGKLKIESILGALRTRIINVLITDEKTAREVMLLNSKSCKNF
jgi:DNA-binding transcriptional regulator LsrR (DeoR family)